MILAIDQGTTGTTCLVVDERLRPVGRGYREIAQSYPEPGWVEHDPEEIWASVLLTAEAALADAGIRADELARWGSRTSARRRSSGSAGAGAPCTPRSSGKTGARLRGVQSCPPTSSESVPGSCVTRTSRRRSSSGFSRTSLPQQELAFGTIDSWLAWKLTGGRRTSPT